MKNKFTNILIYVVFALIVYSPFLYVMYNNPEATTYPETEETEINVEESVTENTISTEIDSDVVTEIVEDSEDEIVNHESDAPELINKSMTLTDEELNKFKNTLLVFLKTPEGYVERKFYVYDSHVTYGTQDKTIYDVQNGYDFNNSTIEVTSGGVFTWYDADRNILWQTTDFVIINNTVFWDHTSINLTMDHDDIHRVLNAPQ